MLVFLPVATSDPACQALLKVGRLAGSPPSLGVDAARRLVLHLTVRSVLQQTPSRKKVGKSVRHRKQYDAPGETWLGIDTALRDGLRGLRGGSSLAQLLAKRRNVRNKAAAPRLTVETILAWADAYHQRRGTWPGQRSGPIAEAFGETWSGVHCALYEGLRGLPGGDSLHQLLVRTGRKQEAGT